MGTTYRLTATGREALRAALATDTLGPGDAWIPADLCEPVGLEMAEPGPAAFVRVQYDGDCFAAHRSGGNVSPWGCTDGRRRDWAELCALPGVSITVLEPRWQVEPVALPLEIEATSKRLPTVFLDRSQLDRFAARLALHGSTESISRSLFAYECRVIVNTLTQLADEWDSGHGGVA